MSETTTARTPGTGELHSFLRILRRRAAIVIGLTAVVVGSAVGFTMAQTPTYSATARVLVKPLNPDQALAGYNYGFLISMQTEKALAESRRVARIASELVLAQAGSALDTGSISVEVPPETTFLDLTYTDPDAAAAQRWAEAYARAYTLDREERAADAYASASAGYQANIDQVQADLDAKLAELAVAVPEDVVRLEEQVDTLRGQINVLRAQLAQLPVPSRDSAQIVGHAQTPTAPSSPDPERNIALALLVGVSLGVLVAMLRERLDDRLSGREELEERIDAPTLAIVPSVKGWRRRGKPRLFTLDRPSSPPSEAYRTIRANLEHLARTSELHTIMITSGTLGEGKTTVTGNLGVSLAQTGRRVIVLSCDLRKPRLHRFFGLPNEPGVTSLLNGETTLPEALQRTGVDTLRVLVSGPVPNNPAELLGSERMGRLLRDLRTLADYVLIDSPPVLAVADALVLAPHVDGVVVVVDAQTTTRDAVTAVREQLQQVGAAIVGGVYNNLDRRRARYYPSYYRHYYSYGDRPRAERREVTSEPLPVVTPDAIWAGSSPPAHPVLAEQSNGSEGRVRRAKRTR